LPKPYSELNQSPLAQSVTYFERWRDSLLWWRQPARTAIETSSSFGLSGSLIPHERLHLLTLRDLRIEQGRFWQRWCGAATLRATVNTSGDPITFTICVGPMLALSKFQDDIDRSIQAALTQRKRAVESSVVSFDSDRMALFEKNRYVRHSQVQALIALYRPRFTDDLKRQFISWSTHPRRSKSTDTLKLVQQYESAITLLASPDAIRSQHNREFIASQAIAHADYFAKVESTGLTSEQVKASLTFDDANVTVAAAGSGKTSVIVSKTGYVLKTEMFSEDQILVLAFNAAAARELRERIANKVSIQLGRSVHVTARTFHSLGFRLYLRQLAQRRTGAAKPRPKLIDFNKLTGQRLLRKLLLDLLSHPANRAFADAVLQWAADYRYPAPELSPCDAGTLEDRERRYETMCKRISRGSRRDAGWFDAAIPTFDPRTHVRSNEEARIANWLYLRRVDFEYERAAPKWITGEINKGLPENEHVKVYKPDFTYANPADENKRFVHEHFGLNAKGRAPNFLGVEYEARATHKRQVLQSILGKDGKAEASRFIETRSAQCFDGSIFDYLERQLKMRGIPVGPVDEGRRDRALKELSESGPLMDLIGEFVPRFRNSGLSFGDLEARAHKLDPYNQGRALAFLRWIQPYMEVLQSVMNTGIRASDGGGDRPLIDFAGMVANAVKLLKESPSPLTDYKLILVDEFQDISRPNAQLVQGLLDQHPDDSVLFCVGDDWQAINRFAGADVAIFKSTHDGLHANPSRSANCPIEPRSTDATMLRKTFRCAQGIADVARWFVMQAGNSAHIDKEVVADNPEREGVVRVVEHTDDADARALAVHRELHRIIELNRDRPSSDVAITVFVLTRNRREEKLPLGLRDGALATMTEQYARLGLNVMHKSLHGSKGLGGDYVIVAGMDAGPGGFPTDFGQEPLIELLLPSQRSSIDEERRLFYVGLTRAKREVTLLCVAERPSVFIAELEKYPVKDVVTFERLPGVTRHLCQHCRSGWLRRRHAKPVVECSRTPFCGFVGPASKFPGLPEKKSVPAQ
jgi:DNA helicase IV